MASDDEFILYDVTSSVPTLGRADLVRHARDHSDEAESSHKQYSPGDGRDDYSEEQDFCGEMQDKTLDVLHGEKELDGIGLAMQSQGLLMGVTVVGGRDTSGVALSAGRTQRRIDRLKSKQREREEISDGGSYYKKGKVMGSGAGGGDACNKKDREEWSDGAISCLLDAYTEKYLQLNRGNLRGSDWEEVASVVSDRFQGQKPAKTVDQCKNKVDSLKKRYKTEKSRRTESNGMTMSYWPWFKKVDQIVGTGPSKLAMLSDDEKEMASACNHTSTHNNNNNIGNHNNNTGSNKHQLLSSMANTLHDAIGIPASNVNNSISISQVSSKRLQPCVPQLAFLNTPKKMGSSFRWKRVLLKVSGKSLAGHAQNVDPEVVSLIAREVASVSQLGVEVAIVVGGGNFFHGSSWATSAGLDRVSADHIGMMATVMNAIFLQSSLESIGVQTRVQTAFKLAEIAEPYIRRRAIRHLEKGRVVLFSAGIGNPYFTTDTAAAVRAAEINAEVVLKGTHVNGVHDSDPKTNPDASVLEHLSYRDVVAKGSTVMDITAVSLCQENAIPVVIFNLNEPGNISKALMGERIGTVIDQTGPLY